MTLTERIKTEPYLKISNCTDVADLDWALDIIHELRDKYPKSKMADNLYYRFEYKRMKITGILL